MPSARQELLYDSATALRLVDHELSEHHAASRAEASADAVSSLRDAVREAASELARIRATLRALPSDATLSQSDIDARLLSIATLLETVR